MATSPPNSALRAELGTALKSLQAALTHFADHLRYHTRDAWIWRRGPDDADALTPAPAEPSRGHTIELITDAICAIKYADNQAPHETRLAPGIVVTDEEGIVLAEEINRHKVSLAKVLRAMQDRTEIGVIDPKTGERGKRPLREVALEAFFFRRLHYWQSTRELVVLRPAPDKLATPDYVGFNWARCRDMRRTSREQLLEQLEERRAAAEDLSHFDRDLSVLQALPANEPLVIVKPARPVPKANIAWPTTADRDAPVREIRPAVLPLVMFGDQLPTRLRKLPAAPTPTHFRLARTDTEIEPVPLLQTLSVHRYAAHIRSLKRAQHLARVNSTRSEVSAGR
jgi:hypothetical protein